MSTTQSIPRDHPIAEAVLTDFPAAWLVWAKVIANKRLMLDYAYPIDGDGSTFFDFSEQACTVVESSWSRQDPGPWQQYEPHDDSTWRIEIEAAR
ncbi:MULTISPECIES: hypothetical protein [Mycolicibacterium]|uniref:hypothetical protein n=1 Tax=Mycolicibacterium TaxID=1866885 RepID=UPI001CDCFA5B|nr:hypothetical protein [Mycolicibacterium fortuitum]UBV20321.1 hypothetical protein H8Z59_24060 [Mycolicibacterium fortuitum]